MSDNKASARKPRTQKTSAELKAQLEKMRSALAAMEKKAYAEELGEMIRNSNIVKDFKAIQEKVADVNEVAILEAVAQEVGIKRLTITQAAAPKRKSTPRKKKVATA